MVGVLARDGSGTGRGRGGGEGGRGGGGRVGRGGRGEAGEEGGELARGGRGGQPAPARRRGTREASGPPPSHLSERCRSRPISWPPRLPPARRQGQAIFAGGGGGACALCACAHPVAAFFLAALRPHVGRVAGALVCRVVVAATCEGTACSREGRCKQSAVRYGAHPGTGPGCPQCRSASA